MVRLVARRTAWRFARSLRGLSGLASDSVEVQELAAVLAKKVRARVGGEGSAGGGRAWVRRVQCRKAICRGFGGQPKQQKKTAKIQKEMTR